MLANPYLEEVCFFPMASSFIYVITPKQNSSIELRNKANIIKRVLLSFYPLQSFGICVKFGCKFVAWLTAHTSTHICPSHPIAVQAGLCHSGLKAPRDEITCLFKFLCVGFLWKSLSLTWRLHLKSDLRDSFLMKCNKASNNLLGQLLAKLPVYPF